MTGSLYTPPNIQKGISNYEDALTGITLHTSRHKKTIYTRSKSTKLLINSVYGIPFTSQELACCSKLCVANWHAYVRKECTPGSYLNDYGQRVGPLALHLVWPEVRNAHGRAKSIQSALRLQ